MLKMPKWIEAAAIALLAAASILIPSCGRLILLWSRSSRWLSRAHVALTVAASITFFGHQQGRAMVAAAARLNAEREAVRADYASTREAVESAVTTIAAQEAVGATPAARQWLQAHETLGAARAEAARARQAGAAATRFAAWQARVADAERPQRYSAGRTRPAAPTPTAATTTSGGERPSAVPDHWTRTTGTAITEEIKAPAAARAPGAGGALSAVENKVAEALHGEWKKQIVKPVLATVGLEGDLVELVLDPLLQTPTKEWLKQRVAETVDAILARGMPIPRSVDRFRATVRERFSSEVRLESAGSNPIVDEIARYQQRALELSAEIRDIVRAANAELDARAAGLLVSESTGRWGSLRQSAAGIYRASLYDAAQKALALEAFDRWNRRKPQIARAALSMLDRGGAVAWEAEFFRYLQTDPDLAAAWGYLVIATQPVTPHLRSDVIPEDGMIHYVEAAGLGTAADVRLLYSAPAVVKAIDALCPKTHPPVAEASPFAKWLPRENPRLTPKADPHERLDWLRNGTRRPSWERPIPPR
jgi:hypothetical protein